MLPPWIGSLPVQVASPIAFTQGLAELADSDTVSQLTELTQWGTGADSGTVVALTLSEGDSILRAAYETDHMLRNWKLDDRSLVSAFDIGSAGHSYTRFDPAGDRVVSTAQKEEGAKYPPTINLWDTNTGVKIETFEIYSYDTWGIDANRYVFIPNTQIVLEYSGGTINDRFLRPLQDARGNTYLSGGGYAINSEDGWRGKAGRMASDAQGDFVALAFQEGLMRIYPASYFKPNRFSVGGFSYSSVFDFGQAESRQQPVHDLQFDPTRRWLGQIWGDELRVWKVGYPRPTHYLAADTPGANVLAFDRTGQFLFVGTERSVQVWDLVTKQLAKEYAAADDVSAILVSPDNRLVIYGDTAGGIHLLGKANQP